MTDAATLLRQINRAKRYAAAMTNDAEKKRFAVIAEEFEQELVAMEEPTVSNSIKT